MLGSYIEVFIEPEIGGLRWQTLLSKVALEQSASKFSLNRLLDRIIPTSYAVTSLFSSLYGSYLIYIHFPRLDFRLIIAAVIILIIIQLDVIYNGYKNGTIVSSEYWKKLLRKVKEEEAKPASD